MDVIVIVYVIVIALVIGNDTRGRDRRLWSAPSILDDYGHGHVVDHDHERGHDHGLDHVHDHDHGHDQVTRLEPPF